MADVLDHKIEDLELSVRTCNCLKNFLGANASLRDLVSITPQELLNEPNFGKKSLKELEEVLGKIGLALGSVDPVKSAAVANKRLANMLYQLQKVEQLVDKLSYSLLRLNGQMKELESKVNLALGPARPSSYPLYNPPNNISPPEVT